MLHKHTQTMWSRSIFKHVQPIHKYLILGCEADRELQHMSLDIRSCSWFKDESLGKSMI